MSHEAVIEQLNRAVSPELYEKIRKEWKAHSIAEDNRDIAGLMATLTDDCVYELPQRATPGTAKKGLLAFTASCLERFRTSNLICKI